MVSNPNSPPSFSSVDMDDLIVPDTPEYLWPTHYSIDRSFLDGTLSDTVVPETELDSFVPDKIFEYFADCDCPYYGPPPPATPYYGPPSPATPVTGPPVTPVDPPEIPKIVYSEAERQTLAILLPRFLDLIKVCPPTNYCLSVVVDWFGGCG